MAAEAREPGTRGMGGDQRLNHILATAEEMFFDKGYRGVSIRDLAAAVGIQMSTLYYYFQSKDEILYRIINRHVEELLEMAQGVVASDKNATQEAKLRALIRESIVYLIADRRAAGISTSQGRELGPERNAELSSIIKRYEALYLELIRDGMKSGEFIETDPVLASFIILAAQVRLSAWYKPGGRLSPEDVAETYSKLLVRGLATKQD